MTTTTAPIIGSRVHAITATGQGQKVIVEVTAIDESNSNDREWVVWGYRIYRNRRNGVRQTAFPRMYLVER